MKRIIISTVFALCSLIAQAEVQIQIDPSVVTKNETFQLTLIQDGTQGGVPDLSVLNDNFLIVGTERHINYSVINGQSTTSSQWVITLKPLKSGVLSIPAIKIGTEKSSAMTINVEAGNNKASVPDLDQQAVALTTSVNTTKPYVNQQVIYTVKLYNSKRLLDADYQAPQIEDALLIPLGDAKRYQSMKDNVNYVVEEQNYAVYPQKSGELKILSPVFSAVVYDIDSQRIKAQDKPTTLNVQPVPKKYQAGGWLPARQVTLKEQYENTNQTLGQGTTLIRTVTLEGVAVPAQLLPQLHFEGADAFSVYPEKGTERNQVKQGELVGSTEFKVTYLFNKPGKVIIPELRIQWFNTETGKDEFALLAPKSMEIIPASVSSTSNAPTTPMGQAITTAPTPRAGASFDLRQQVFWGWIAALVFAVAWVLTLILWYAQRHSKPCTKGQGKRALAQLKKACVNHNPKGARDAILNWARVQWPDASVLNLGDLNPLIRDAALKKQIQALSQVLYKNQSKELWRGEELLAAISGLKQTKRHPVSSRDVLPPINP